MRLIVKYQNGHMSELFGVYSAVMYHDESETASGGASSACGEQSLFASMNETAPLMMTGGDEQRGDGVGFGRIGGMGERKERGEEAGREKGHPCIYKMVFRCSDGETFAPVAVLDLAVSKYGEQSTHEEMVKAAQWLIANPGKKRKKKGLGTFLMAWFERSAQFRAERRRMNSGNLLNEETTDQAW